MAEAVAGRLVGRDSEIAVFANMLAELRLGRGGLVWVEGEPGAGKTALVTAVLEARPGSGMRVFRAAGDPLSQPFGLRLMADCLGLTAPRLDTHRREIADILEGRRFGLDALSAAHERMVALVQRECGKSPVALVLDDIHWADDASLGLWLRLAGMIDQLQLLIVGVCRPVPLRGEITRLREAVVARPNGALLRLDGLDESAANAMATLLLRQPPGPRLRKVVNSAAGNPLYIRELLHALKAENHIRSEGDVAELASPSGSWISSVDEAIGRHLAFLTEHTRDALRAGAILGNTFTLDNLAIVSGLSVASLRDAVSEAVASGILVSSGPNLAFRHALIQQALSAEMPPAASAALHSKAARTLADRGVPWDRVAQQILASGLPLEEWSIDWLARVHSAALSALPDVAIHLLERGRAATASDDPRRDLFTARLTTALRLQHRDRDLLAVGEAALQTILEPQHVGEIVWNMARAYNANSRFDDEDAVVSRVLTENRVPRPWRSRLRAIRGFALMGKRRVADAEAEARLAIIEGERDRDPNSIGWAMMTLALCTSDPVQAHSLILGGIRAVVGEDPESIDLRLLLHCKHVATLGELCLDDEFDAALPTALTLAESAGFTRIEQVNLFVAEHFWSRGDSNRSLLHLDQAQSLAGNYGLRMHGLSALIAAQRDQRSLAEKHLAAPDIEYHTGPARLHAARLIEAEALLAEIDGRLSEAVRNLAGWLEPQYDQSGSSGRPLVLRQLIRLANADGDEQTVRATLATAESDAAKIDDPARRIEFSICKALVADEPGPLLDAAEYFAGVRMLPDVAFALQEAAVRLASQGDLSTARSAFNRAADVYDDMDAPALSRRLQAAMRPYGIHRGGRARNRRVTIGWEALTPSEKAIVDRIRHGDSNPEIAALLQLSRRTVETHVSHILAKLQVRSRADIALVANRQSALLQE